MKKNINKFLVVVAVFFSTGVFGQSISFADKAIEAQPGEEVVIFDGEIDPSGLDVIVKNPSLVFNASEDMDELVSNFVLTLGTGNNSIVSPSQMVGELNFSITIQSTDLIPVRLVANIASTAAVGESFELEDITLSSFEAVLNANTGDTIYDATGHVSHRTVEIVGANIFVARVDGLNNRNILTGTQDELMMTTRVYHTGGGINIGQMKFTAFGVNSESFNKEVMGTLYMDGTPIRSATLQDGVIVFPSLNIESSQTVDLDIRFDFTNNIPVGSSLWIELTGVWDDDMNEIDVDQFQSAEVTIVEASAVVEIGSNMTEGMFLLTGQSGYMIASVNISAEHSDLKLTDIYFHNLLTLELDNRIYNVELFDNDDLNIPLAFATTLNAKGVGFEGMDAANIFIEAGTTKTFVLKLSLNAVYNISDLLNKDRLQFSISDEDFVNPSVGTIDGVRFVAMENGMIVTDVSVTDDPVSNEHRVVAALPTFSKTDFSPEFEESISNVIKFNITAYGGDIVLDFLDFSLTGVTAGTLKIYADAVIPENLIASASYDEAMFLMNGFVIPGWTSEEFYIVLENSVGTGVREFEINFASYAYVLNNESLYLWTSEFIGSMLLPIFENYDQGSAGMKDDEYTKFVVYPNPVTTTMTIENYENADHAELYDMFGKKIMDIRESQVDMSALQNGVYIVRFVGSDSRVSESMSIVKQ